MVAKKVHEALVVVLRQAETFDEPVVATAAFHESFLDHRPHLPSIQVALHERFVDDLPERLLGHPLEQILRGVARRSRAQPFTPPEVLQGTAFTFVQSSAESLRLVWGVAPPEMCANAGDAIVQCTRFPLNRAFLAAVALLSR